MERRQVYIPEQLLGNIRRIVIAPAVRRAVTREVLHARDYRIGPQFIALEPAHLRPRHGRPQIGILARAFHNAPPACIARNIHHRRKRPLDSRRTCVLCCSRLISFTSTSQRIDPTPPFSISASGFSDPSIGICTPEDWLSCPTFSSRLNCARRRFARCSASSRLIARASVDAQNTKTARTKVIFRNIRMASPV